MSSELDRSAHMRGILGDPFHVIFFTIANSMVVAIASAGGWQYQVMGVIGVGVSYVGLALYFGDRRYREQLFRTLPGQMRYLIARKIVNLKETGVADVKFEWTGEYFGKTPKTHAT